MIAAVDFTRLGTVVRAVRLKKRWRQSDLATHAKVSRAAVSRLERGHAGELGVDDLLRIVEALDVGLRISAVWRGGELDRLLNSRHSALHESVARSLLGQPRLGAGAGGVFRRLRRARASSTFSPGTPPRERCW